MMLDAMQLMPCMSAWSVSRYDDLNKEFQKELAGLQAKFQSQYGEGGSGGE